MSSELYWRDTFNVFGPLFYELLGFYESSYDREPIQIISDYEKVNASSETLPLYGKTSLPRYVMYLTQLPLVMRLRDIRQLSSTHILFPGATHTRYEHSLGVMEKSYSILKKITDEKKANVDPDDEVILRIASILHDLGHPAWGHALDGITGFVVELLGETMETYTPKKLDSAITFFLLLKNEQMKKALNNCSLEIKDPYIKSNLEKVVAQIIIEEKRPLYDKMADNPTLLRKIHFLTTILGTYHYVGGINADRIDWIARDAHHANLGGQLQGEEALLKKYEDFTKKVKSTEFEVEVKNGEFCSLNKDFLDTMDSLREKIYQTFYEGLERSFSDSLLIRLFHSATTVLHISGKSFASPNTTARAIMGYLLMPDDRVKEYTARILFKGRENQRLLESDSSSPTVLFIVKSQSLLKLFDESIVYIMHHLNSKDVRLTERSELIDFEYVKLVQIGKTMIVVTSKAYSQLLEKALTGNQLNEAVKIGLFFQDFLVAAKTNPITALKLHTLEALLDRQFPHADIFLLVNYYFFRRLDDNFKSQVKDLKSLKKVLDEMNDLPLFFILTDKTDPASIKKIFETFGQNIIEDLYSYFQAPL